MRKVLLVFEENAGTCQAGLGLANSSNPDPHVSTAVLSALIPANRTFRESS